MMMGYAALSRDSEEMRKLAKELREGTFDYIELSLDYPVPVRKDYLSEVLEVVRSEGLRYSFHAPWRGIDLASPWEPLRRGAVEVIKNILKLASEFEAMYVVIHLTTSERLSDSKDDVLSAAVKSVRELLETAERENVKFYIENVGKLGHPDLLGFIMDETRAEFCLDLVHAIIDFARRHKIDLERVDPEEVLDTWRNALGRNVRCVHVHGYSMDNGRLKIHTTLRYPITKRVAAKYVSLMDPEYVTLEIFYSDNGPASPRLVARELNELIGWMRVYGRRGETKVL